MSEHPSPADIPEYIEKAAECPAESQQPKNETILPYHERYYLKYCTGKRTAPQDLTGTRNFLNLLGFDGGELRQAREQKNRAQDLQNTDYASQHQLSCSYCGAALSGVEFFRLPDGRVRCSTCSSTIVKNAAEITELCQRVIANMDQFFGASLTVPVSVEITEERKLQKKAGIPLGAADPQDILILGAAICKKKKYFIALENGAPRISLIATFAHELTHIWQYTHWDNNRDLKKCAESKRLLIYEGMAKWAEIQYLYLIGETDAAMREEFLTQKRQDEYGSGFRLYENWYPLSRKAMSCIRTPFTPDRYPFT